MARFRLAVGIAAIVILTASVPAAGGASQQDGVADVLVDDVVIGEPEQRFGPVRVGGYPAAAEELVVELDLSTLERHGVGIDDAEIALDDDAVRGASVTSATISDGRARLVFAPEDDVFSVRSFRLTGLDTANATAASDLPLDASFSAGSARVRSFDIVDPDEVTPTLSPRMLSIERGTQRVTIADIQPTDEAVTVELSVAALESHGIDVSDVTADAEADGATIRNTNVEDGVIVVSLTPAADAALLDVDIALDGFDTSAVDTDDRVVAADVTYDVSIEGNANGSVDGGTFDVVTRYPTPVEGTEPTPPTEPTTLTDTDPATPTPPGGTAASTATQTSGTPTTADGPGFGPLLSLIALTASGLLAVRRR